MNIERSLRERIALILGRIIFYALLALIVLVAIPYGTVEAWWEALFECLVFLLGALWVVEGLLSRRLFVAQHRIFLPLLVICLYAFLQTLTLFSAKTTVAGLELWSAVSADPYETRLTVLKLLALVLSGILLLRYTSSSRRLRALIFTLIATALASAFFGLLRQTTQHAQGFLLPALQPNSGYGQFINRNHFAFLMEMVLGLILGIVIGHGSRREHVLIYIALALPIWTALILCNSRGGLFSMLAQVLLLALVALFTRRGRDEEEREERGLFERVASAKLLRPVLVAGLIAVVFIGALWIGGEALTSRLETVSSEVSAAETGNVGTSRMDIWRATWKMIKENPLTGVGFNGYWAAIPQYHPASGVSTPQQAHNDYLELLASGGIIGVALVLWFLWLVVKGVRRGYQAQDSFRRAASLGAGVGLFGVAVHSLVDFGLHVTINALVFTALVVIAVAQPTDTDENGAGARRLNQRAVTG